MSVAREYGRPIRRDHEIGSERWRGWVSAFAGTAVTIVGGALIESKPDNFALIGGSLKGQPDYNFSWTITNSGLVEGKGANSTGGVLYGGGKIVNADIGYISGGRHGVYIYYQPATVNNFGTVSAYGTSGTGIFLSAGGQVFNAGTVSGDVGGVKIIKGAQATVANYGTIRNRANAGFGVYLEGFLGNFVSSGPGAYIGADVIEIGAPATLVNAGTIEDRGGRVSLGRGGVITNGVSGSTATKIDVFSTYISGGKGKRRGLRWRMS